MTKAQMLLWMASAFAFIMSAMWVVLLNHASTPHRDAVHTKVFEQVLLNQAEWRDEARGDYAEIKYQITELQRILLSWKEAP